VVQSFKGSLRRSCFVSPTLGEQELQFDQFCGVYIDPTTLDDTSYIQLDGSPAGSMEEYICPLGQVCRICVCVVSYVFYVADALFDLILGNSEPE